MSSHRSGTVAMTIGPLASRLDRRADGHALGAVAYDLLTGRQARSGDLMSLLQAELPPAPSSFRPGLEHLDDVILRPVHPQVERRWDDPTSFARALRTFRRGAAADFAARGLLGGGDPLGGMAAGRGDGGRRFLGFNVLGERPTETWPGSRTAEPQPERTLSRFGRALYLDPNRSDCYLSSYEENHDERQC